jgi:hypothetical protein
MSLHYTAILASLGTIATGLSLSVKPLHSPTLHQNGIHSGEFSRARTVPEVVAVTALTGIEDVTSTESRAGFDPRKRKQKVNETEPVWPRTRASELPQFEQPNPVEREGTFSFKGRPRVDQEMLLHEER